MGLLGYDSTENRYHRIKQLAPGECLTTLHEATFFGLDEHFPHYYGADDLHQRALHFKTTKMIKVLDIGAKGFFCGINPLRYSDHTTRTRANRELELQIDGWIGFDDPQFDWREIMLYNPHEVVDARCEMYTDLRTEHEKKGYFWGEKEVQRLRDNIVGYQNVTLTLRAYYNNVETDVYDDLFRIPRYKLQSVVIDTVVMLNGDSPVLHSNK